MVINPVLMTQIPQNLAHKFVLGYIWGSSIKVKIWPNLRSLRDHFVSFLLFFTKRAIIWVFLGLLGFLSQRAEIQGKWVKNGFKKFIVGIHPTRGVYSFDFRVPNARENRIDMHRSDVGSGQKKISILSFKLSKQLQNIQKQTDIS